ncbi:uncharacterized protein [Diabrotica undecimpunctata]|uniref:uncharacterized protein n=1 Tax=Diabrotica undecimpunctata TaxID=50387 RepID=UPI003B6320E6
MSVDIAKNAKNGSDIQAGEPCGLRSQPKTVVHAGNISSLATFRIGDDFEIFEERLEQYLLANLVEEARKVAVLLTLLSEDIYKVLKNLCAPSKPKEKSFDDIMALLKSQFKPRIAIYRRRIKFETLRQEDETINEWYIKVKNMATQCEFGDKLMYRVQEKFVVGIKAGPILDRLCEEDPHRTLKDLLEIALAKEAALRESRGVDINYSEAKREGGKKIQARQPGSSNQTKTGHIAAACKVRRNNFIEMDNNVDAEDNTSEVDGMVEMLQIYVYNVEAYIKPMSITVLINQQPLVMEIDTGAGVSCIPFNSNYPLPLIEDIFAALKGGEKFTKLDFKNAYNQLELDPETSHLLSWSKPYGIFRVKRLPYGTKPACSIFQCIVEKVLQGCKGTVNYLDDVVVTGKDNKEHLENLAEVLKRLLKAGFRLNLSKCEFVKDCIFY